MGIWPLRTTTKQKPHHTQERGAYFTLQQFLNHKFSKTVQNVDGGGGVSPVSCIAVQLFLIKAPLTPSGPASSRKFFTQNSAFNPLSSRSGPLSPPLCSGSLPLSAEQEGELSFKVNGWGRGGGLTEPTNQIKHWSVTKVYGLKGPQSVCSFLWPWCQPGFLPPPPPPAPVLFPYPLLK